MFFPPAIKVEGRGKVRFVAHLTLKTGGLVQCLCGENIFTLAQKVMFSGFCEGKTGLRMAALANVYAGMI